MGNTDWFWWVKRRRELEMVVDTNRRFHKHICPRCRSERRHVWHECAEEGCYNKTERECKMCSAISRFEQREAREEAAKGQDGSDVTNQIREALDGQL